MTNNSNIIRVKWIDIAKGILILLVVLGHIPVECRMIMAENCKWISYYDVPHHFVRSFFMQAFFILTGLTSSFDKPFSIYLKGCMKGFIIPYLFFSIVTFGISRILWNQPAYFTIGGEKYFFLLENYWFLHALLGAKLLCFVLHRYIKNDFIIASILLAAIALSFSITDSYSDFASPSHYKNYFHYRNTLALTFFMWFGYLIKGCLNTRKYIIMGGGYSC